MHHIFGWGFFISMGLCVAGGIYRGLQSHFGSNLIKGWREYKEDCELHAKGGLIEKARLYYESLTPREKEDKWWRDTQADLEYWNSIPEGKLELFHPAAAALWRKRYIENLKVDSFLFDAGKSLRHRQQVHSESNNDHL